MFGGSYLKMALYGFIILMLVALVDFFSRRELYGYNLIACVCMFCFCFDVLKIWTIEIRDR